MTRPDESIESEPTEVIFCVGSNCNDREASVEAALKWLSEMLMDFRRSPIYATPDCHGGQREYMNAVAIGKTMLQPPELELACKEYEVACGRDAAARAAGDVPVDVDTVVYGNTVLRIKDYRCEFFLRGYKYLTRPDRTRGLNLKGNCQEKSIP